MSFIAGIPHPLLNETGTGQVERLLKNLDPENIKVDARQKTEILDFINRYARQVNHYNGQLNIGDWQPFFSKSQPFLVASIYHFDVAGLESNYDSLYQLTEQNPVSENIHLLFDFIYTEVVYPLHIWEGQFAPQESAFGLEIDNLISANLQKPIKTFIGLFNAAHKWYCVPKRSFSKFLDGPWGLEFPDLFALNESFRSVPAGPAGRILALRDALGEIFQQFLNVIRELSRGAKEFLKESLVPVSSDRQKRNAPHLGLLFTFLQLFEYLQKDLNDLSREHLKYFYQDVLGIKPAQLVPDQAHLVLEIQKNLKRYFLEKGRLFKNGKDKNGNDIFYKLDEEAVVDQAQITSLKTLFIDRQKKAVSRSCISLTDENGGETSDNNEADDCLICDFIDGVYMAPIANSADGKGEAFAEPDTASWSTLGAADSKFFEDEPVLPSSHPLPHPDARIGFVVASPVLLLKEGVRTVTFVIKGKYNSTEDCELSLLNLDFSNIGEEGWSIFNFCITDEVLGLGPQAKSYLDNKIDNAEKLCFEDKSAFEAFLNVENDTVFSDDDKDLLHTISTSSSTFCIPLTPIPGLSPSGRDFIERKRAAGWTLCFDTLQELEAFIGYGIELGDRIFSDTDQEILLKPRNIDERKSEFCLSREGVDSLEGLTQSAKGYLMNRFEERARLCFVDEEELAAFLSIESETGDPVFSKAAKSQIFARLIPRPPFDQYCITQNTLDDIEQNNLTLTTGAQLFLENKLAETGNICFDTKAELEAYLTQPIFSGGDDATNLLANRDIITRSARFCITRDTLSDLQTGVRNYLADRLEQNERICFATIVAVEDFLDNHNDVFSESDKEYILENVERFPARSTLCIDRDFVDDMMVAFPTGIGAAYLDARVTQDEPMCFENVQELKAFLSVEDVNGGSVPVFSPLEDEYITVTKINLLEEVISQRICITPRSLAGLEPAASEFLQEILVEQESIRFLSEEELDAFLNLKDEADNPVFDSASRDKIKESIEADICITPRTTSVLSVTEAAYLNERLAENADICFTDLDALNTFLAENSTHFTQADIDHIRTNAELSTARAQICIPLAIVNEMPDGLGEGKAYLQRRIKEEEPLCYANEQELKTLLRIKKAYGDTANLFDNKEELYLRNRIDDLNITYEYCITEALTAGIGLQPAAKAFLEEIHSSQKKILFRSREELEAYLDLFTFNGNPQFDQATQVLIRENVELKNIQLSKQTLLEITYLSDEARKALFLSLQRSNKICFENREEFLDYLESTGADGEPLFDQADQAHLTSFAGQTRLYETKEPLFKINFSGEKEWIPAENFVNRFLVDEQADDGIVTVEIEGIIGDDVDPVTFADSEALGEDFQTHLPLAKVELNPDIKLNCEGAACEPDCGLSRCLPVGPVTISLYHFLKDLVIEDFCIDVRVCGLRNFVVQNDEALQDVNAPIFPFGTRPSKGSNFYIGSQEIFCKNWQKLWVNINWKDLPEDFEAYYRGYGKVTSEGLANVTRDELFKMQLSVLQELAWKAEKDSVAVENEGIDNPYTEEGCPDTDTDKEDHRHLFETSDPFNPLWEPPNPFQQRLEVDAQFFGLEKVAKTMQPEPITEYFSDTQNGFMRMTLRCQDFRHREYPFVLARQMLAFGKFPEEFVFGAVYVYEDDIVVDEDGFITYLKEESISLFDFFQQVDRACELALQGDTCSTLIVDEIKNALETDLVGELKAQLQIRLETDINAKLDELKVLLNAGKDTLESEVILNLNTTLRNDLKSEISNLIATTLSSANLDPLVTSLNLAFNILTSSGGSIHTSIETALTSFINDISADAITFENTAAAILTAVRAGFQNPNDSVFDDFKTLIADKILELVNAVASDAILTSFTEDLVDNDIAPTVGGVSVAERDDLINAIRPLLENLRPDQAAIDGKADEVHTEIIALLDAAFTPGDPNQIWGDDLLNSQLPTLLNDFLDDLTNDAVNQALIDTVSTNIANMVQAEVETYNDTTVRTGIETLLSDLSNILQPTAVGLEVDNEIDTAIATTEQLFDDNLDIDLIIDTNSEVSTIVNDAVEAVFTTLGYDNVSILKIVQGGEVDLCACGVYDDDCNLDTGRYEMIRDLQIAAFIGMERNAGETLEDYQARIQSDANYQVSKESYLKNFFDFDPIEDDEQELTDLIKEYCEELEKVTSALDADLEQKQEEYIAGVEAEESEEELERLKNALDEATKAWSDAAKPFVALLERLDDLTEEGTEPVVLRALLPYVGLEKLTRGLNVFLRFKKLLNAKIRKGTVAIPNEPYTPEIKEIALDYIARACKGEKDFNLIHLYPFEGTNKRVGFAEQSSNGNEPVDEPAPHLLPHHTDSGTLYLGFENLNAGSNVQLLFQLAEATGDTELLRPNLEWAYLHRDNKWEPLLSPKHILEDATKDLTTSGIVKIAIPKDIAKPQPEGEDIPPEDTRITIMPPQHRWIKVSATSNAEAFSETVGIFTQAVKVTYAPQAVNEREQMVLEPEQIAAFAQADSNVKGIVQPFQSFGGRLPEAGNTFNRRVSERLRHKGRSISGFDYEHIVLEYFPKIYRAKCINHSLGLPAPEYFKDMEVAPGFINLAVIPDLAQLNLGNPLEPRAPMSLLSEIRDFLKKKSSPFVRLRVMNPRYEKVNIEVEVQFRAGKDKDFFSQKLEEDIMLFLAPWLAGKPEKLNFGQNVTRSALIQFIENLDYIDFINWLGMVHGDDVCTETSQEHADSEVPENGATDTCTYCETKAPNCNLEAVLPMTARSILTAGSITIKVFEAPNENN